MALSITRLTLVLGTLAASLGFADLAMATEPIEQPIPTQIINMPDVVDLSGPCSLCRADAITTDDDTTENRATLELYYDDETGTFVGDLELTILLDSGEYRVRTIEGVELLEAETSFFELGPEQEWDWAQDVTHIWVEAVRTAG